MKKPDIWDTETDIDPILYRQGRNPNEALDYLADLSDESNLTVSTRSKVGIDTHSGPYPGPTVAESIHPEPGEGYGIAIFDREIVEDPGTIPESELYIAFSNDLPASNLENPGIDNGAIIQGMDKGHSTNQLVNLAERHLQKKLDK